MTLPNWGTPDAGPHDPDRRDEAVDPEQTGNYLLVVEQSVGSGQSMRWGVNEGPWFVGASRRQAREGVARWSADWCRTNHPKSQA